MNYGYSLSLRGGLIKCPCSRLKNELMLELCVPPSDEGLPITSPEVLENPRYGRWR